MEQLITVFTGLTQIHTIEQPVNLLLITVWCGLSLRGIIGSLLHNSCYFTKLPLLYVLSFILRCFIYFVLFLILSSFLYLMYFSFLFFILCSFLYVMFFS